MTIKLGDTYQDTVSGVKGVAIIRSQKLSGQVQFALQPKGDGTKLADAIFVDEHHLKRCGKGVDATPAAPQALSLGWELEDIVSGYFGIAVDQATFTNGCVQYGLQPKFTPSKEKAEIPDLVYFDHKRLKKKSDGVVADLAPPPAPKAPKVVKPIKSAKPPGGPSVSARSMRSA